MKPQHTGLRRIVKATGYSLNGLTRVWQTEAAFRQELILSAVLALLAIFLDVTTVERILLITVLGIVVIVELLNSAIETVVDRIGAEYHEMSGAAKDIGSAAVLLSLLMAAFVWFNILFFRD